MMPLEKSTCPIFETVRINIISALGKIGGQKAKEKLTVMKKNTNGLLIKLIDDALKKMVKK